jgi:EAL domain-containing protein (putative c-di-GMP-specific phosphodiesterase class I)
VNIGEPSPSAQPKANIHDIDGIFVRPQLDLRTGAVVCLDVVCAQPRHAPTPTGVGAPQEDSGHRNSHRLSYELMVQTLKLMMRWDVDASIQLPTTPFRDPAFTRWMERCVRTVGPTRQLTVEVTPHASSDPVARDSVAQLRTRGLGIIARLKWRNGYFERAGEFGATELRLDHLLMADASAGVDAVIAHAVAFAHCAGARVVAEGVNTPAQLDRVTRLGCDRAQGDLNGPPVLRSQIPLLYDGGKWANRSDAHPARSQL